MLDVKDIFHGSFSSAESLGNLGCSSVGICCSFQRFSKSVSRTEATHFNVSGLALGAALNPLQRASADTGHMRELFLRQPLFQT